jgi:hypothetical protein
MNAAEGSVDKGPPGHRHDRCFGLSGWVRGIVNLKYDRSQLHSYTITHRGGGCQTRIYNYDVTSFNSSLSGRHTCRKHISPATME